MGLDALGFSSRELSKMSLFSTLAGGGLLGCGVRVRAVAAGLGAGAGTDASRFTGSGAEMGAESGAAAGAAAFGRGRSGTLATGLLVPGGGASSFAGKIW